MENVISFEILVCKEYDENSFEILTTGFSNELKQENDLKYIKATYITVQQVKFLLSQGKKLLLPKIIDHPEVVLNDIVIVNPNNEFESKKNILLREIENRIHQNILNVCVIDSMDYMDCYMKLLNNGIFITDKNREEKYFEIIEASQTVECPDEPTEDSTFEEEQEYFKKKEEYDRAQANLETLEKYLNAYDNLSKIRYVNQILTEAKNGLYNAETDDELNETINKFNERLTLFNNNPEKK